MRLLLLAAAVALAACAEPGPPSESDAHAVLDPDRDVWVDVAGVLVRATDVPGAEDGEAVSPDGKHVVFVGGATGIASVWVAAVPASPDADPATPVQLTNVGLEHVRREPGQPPPGFVPPPDRGPLRWLDDRTVAWTAAGVEHTARLPD